MVYYFWFMNIIFKEIVDNPFFIAFISAVFTGMAIYAIEMIRSKIAERRKIDRLKKIIISELEILRHDIKHLIDYYEKNNQWPPKRSQSNFPFDMLVNYINELTSMPIGLNLQNPLFSTIPLIYDLGGGNLEYEFRGYETIEGYKAAYDQFRDTINILQGYKVLTGFSI